MLTSNELHVWWIALDDRRASSLRSELSPAEAARCASFLTERDRRRYEVAHRAMRDVLARYVAGPVDLVEPVSSGHGKPQLRDHDRVRFSLAHSRELAVIAVAEREVGIDIEFVRPIDGLAIAARLWPEYHTALAALPEDRQVRAFFEQWTRREAHAKARGVGLAAIDDPAIEGDPRWYCRSFEVADGYVGAAVVEAPDVSQMIVRSVFDKYC